MRKRRAEKHRDGGGAASGQRVARGLLFGAAGAASPKSPQHRRGASGAREEAEEDALSSDDDAALLVALGPEIDAIVDDDTRAALRRDRDDPPALVDALALARMTAAALVRRARAAPLAGVDAKRRDPAAVRYASEGVYDCVLTQALPASGKKLVRKCAPAAVCAGPTHALATIAVGDLLDDGGVSARG